MFAESVRKVGDHRTESLIVVQALQVHFLIPHFQFQVMRFSERLDEPHIFLPVLLMRHADGEIIRFSVHKSIR